MKKLTIWSLAFAAGVATALIAGHFAIKKPARLHAAAHWRDIYRTPSGLVAGADLIVEARHVAAAAGRIVGEGEDATPFTDNTFAVLDVLKGELSSDTVVVEQTGGLLPDGVILDINDGGPYEAGSTYLLFLREGEDGKYYVINHQARYRIRDGYLEGVDPTDRVVAALHGWPMDSWRGPVRDRARILR